MHGLSIFGSIGLRGLNIKIGAIALALLLTTSVLSDENVPPRELKVPTGFASYKNYSGCSKHRAKGKCHHRHDFSSLFTNKCVPSNHHKVKSHCCPANIPNWTFRFRR